MKNVKCVHPIKCNRAIKAFLAEILFPIEIALQMNDDTSVDYGVIGDVIEDEEITIFIPNWKRANFLKDDGGKYFRQDFTRRCPMGKGFSDVTISILHEVGHAMTRTLLPEDYNREKECEKVETENHTYKEINFEYFKMLDETLATNWAIAWLRNADHRKKAKAFEKEFWACFE